MDLSALIFVALAVAWAVYLIPKALKQHEDSAASRSIDGFSNRLRVLARREPVDSTTARLIVRGAKPEQDAAVIVSIEMAAAHLSPSSTPSVPLTAAQVRARRGVAKRAAKRRLRVVCTILVGIAVVGALAAVGQIQAVYTLIPTGLLVAWLVACRLMVKAERTSATSASAAATAEGRQVLAARSAVPAPGDDPATEEFAVVHVEADLVVPTGAVDDERAAHAVEATEAVAVAGGWDPVPTTLPTYVGKEPAARRTVRTIDLDSTGVWTSGPLASDSELAREAETAARAAKASADEVDRRRASNS